ncbi:YolD-like family protein [Paenibacillus alvei]|uniref:YolD-like family protein n=1 Tax=Paenibacillus alvei TaxID=44250 RepID=A0ABT4H3B4_PAEAL|nr:YolD-like family protein [Paenibacillus alvei]MCY9763167.1 YolD-like family protein [Paenibacillus alvei]MCY9769542.1 YolD-like family protein [Paenibacillus alvei]
MSKKLQGNGLWESSRLMLPEHKEAYNQHHRNMPNKKRPELDIQELEHLSHTIGYSIQNKTSLTFTLFNESGEIELIGRVISIDQLHGKIKVEQHLESVWIRIHDIIRVS